MKRLPIFLIVVLSLTVAGCGNDESADDTTTTTIETTTTSTSTTPPTTAVGDVPNVSVPPKAIPTVHLTDVRLAHQPEGDRVTFEFSEDTPGYDIGYTTLPPRQSGSGNPVELKGAAGISVRFDPASAVDLTGGLKKTYEGPSRITAPGTTAVTELVSIGDFEAQLVWAIGLNEKRPFKVETFTGPPRVVIDFR